MERTSEVTGVPLATVVDMDRRLVKAGLRAKSGRGFNVAQMTPLDAARLLTAILASSQANLAAERGRTLCADTHRQGAIERKPVRRDGA